MTKGEGPDSFVSPTNTWSYGCFQPRSQGLARRFSKLKSGKDPRSEVGVFLEGYSVAMAT